MDIDVEAARGEEIGKAGIARRVLGQAVVDLDDGARLDFGLPDEEIEVGTGG